MLTDALGPLEVGDRHLAARVGEAVRQLRTRPPRVEWHGHRAGCGSTQNAMLHSGKLRMAIVPIARSDTVVFDEASGERCGGRA